VKVVKNEKRIITIAFAIGGVLLFACCLLWATVSGSWGNSLSHWPQVPPPELFVTSKPTPDGIPGNYCLIQQTINTNGLSIFNGRQCQIELRPDGSFVVTNYPKWFQTNFVQSPTPELISATGRWHSETIGIVRGKSYYGIVFSENTNQFESLALRNDGSPYNLMMTYGDFDEGLFMTFGKQ
jgi:hypothetical protein